MAHHVDSFEQKILGAAIERCFLKVGEDQLEALRTVAESERALAAERELVEKIGLGGVLVALESRSTIQNLTEAFVDVG